MHSNRTVIPVLLALIKARDLINLARLVVLTPVAWIMPQSVWWIFTYSVGFVMAFASPARTLSRIRRIKRVISGLALRPVPSLIELHLLAGIIEQHLQYLREYRPGGWRPRLRVIGREHIDRALERGHGVILWVAPFLSDFLVAKKALYEAGYGITHLSRHTHGMSQTSFGLRFLNPIWIKVESRHVKERLVIPASGELGSLRELETRLRENGLVSITCGDEGHKTVWLPFLGGSIELAPGAVSLALACQAALLPVFSIRKGPGDFEITVEPPLELHHVRDRRESAGRLLKQYVAVLESYFIRYLSLFNVRGWGILRTTPT